MMNRQSNAMQTRRTPGDLRQVEEAKALKLYLGRNVNENA